MAGGRPPRAGEATTAIAARFTAKELAELDRLCGSHGMSRSNLIRHLVAQAATLQSQPRHEADDAIHAVVEAARQTLDSQWQHTTIATIERTLGWPISKVHEALIKARERGLIELHEDTSPQLLPQDEREKAIVGPRGALLTTVLLR